MSIENPTLAHFRHFSHFRHSVNRSFPTDCTILKGVRIITYFQTHSFLTNKANFRKAQMNLSFLYTKDYQNFIPLAGQKNKPNSNPIKPNSQKAKMNINSFITKDYIKKDDFIVRINKADFQNAQNERKLTYNKGLQKKRCFRSPKNKPKQSLSWAQSNGPISLHPKACPELRRRG